MRSTVSISIGALCGALNVGCGDAPCTGRACAGFVETPDDATGTPTVDWGGALSETKDCNNGGGVAEADSITLFYSEEAADDFPHQPIITSNTLRVNQPILVWRSVCNKSNGPAAAQTVSWSRALCNTSNDCPTLVSLGTFPIPGQDNCSCTIAFVEDRVGDDPGEVPGLYRYALSHSGTELASAVVRVE